MMSEFHPHTCPAFQVASRLCSQLTLAPLLPMPLVRTVLQSPPRYIVGTSVRGDDSKVDIRSFDAMFHAVIFLILPSATGCNRRIV